MQQAGCRIPFYRKRRHVKALFFCGGPFCRFAPSRPAFVAVKVLRGQPPSGSQSVFPPVFPRPTRGQFCHAAACRSWRRVGRAGRLLLRAASMRCGCGIGLPCTRPPAVVDGRDERQGCPGPRDGTADRRHAAAGIIRHSSKPETPSHDGAFFACRRRKIPSPRCAEKRHRHGAKMRAHRAP